MSGTATFRHEHRAEVFFEIRPADGGWFLSITVAPTVEVMESLIGGAKSKQAASGPSTQPSDRAEHRN